MSSSIEKSDSESKIDSGRWDLKSAHAAWFEQGGQIPSLILLGPEAHVRHFDWETFPDAMKYEFPSPMGLCRPGAGPGAFEECDKRLKALIPLLEEYPVLPDDEQEEVKDSTFSMLASLLNFIEEKTDVIFKLPDDPNAGPPPNVNRVCPTCGQMVISQIDSDFED